MNRDIMESFGFANEMKMVENRRCPICGEKVNTNDFRDNLSVKEFTISGICQKCQDRIFNRKEE
jgi:transcription initiation factor IIE alpha subunit